MNRVISLKTPFVLAVYVFTDQKKADGNVHLYHYHNIIQEASALNQHLCLLSSRIPVVHRLFSSKDSN